MTFSDYIVYVDESGDHNLEVVNPEYSVFVLALCVIKKDDYVLMAYPSGNRDEDIWERPDEYDITRTFDKDQMGFGHGEHSCPGALLARTDSSVIQERLLDRFPNWELAGTPVRWANPFIQGMTSVPLRFSP